MRVYYDENGIVTGIETFRAGVNYIDTPSPGRYLVVDDIDLTQYDSEDWLVVNGAFVKKPQSEIDARIASTNAQIERINLINIAQDTVDQKLSKTLYDLTSFIKDRFLLNQTQIDQIQAMTTVAQIKNVILDRFSLTPAQEDYIEDFRVSYEAWIAAKE